MLGTLIIKTDILGDMVTSIHATFRKPYIPVTGLAKKYTAEVNERIPIYFRAYNPTDVPLQVQPLVIPSFAVSELKRYDCARHMNQYEMLDDEFENINPNQIENRNFKDCALNFQEEILFIKERNEALPPEILQRVQDLSLFGKLKHILS